MSEQQPVLVTPDTFMQFALMPTLAEALQYQRKTRIVAIGSSSTAGEGQTIPYPHRLEMGLRAEFGDRMIDVLNRGIGGQEAPAELSRFESDVFAEAPELVIWQVGTNAIFHEGVYNPAAVVESIATGLKWLRYHDIDAVLIDPQYAPAIRDTAQKKKATDDMVANIATVARDAGVNLFRRFDLMRHWCEDDKVAIEMLIDRADRLHMTELSTVAISKALCTAIINGAREVP
jgi:acyl-CoA thioesterase I